MPKPAKVEIELETLMDNVEVAEQVAIQLATSAGFSEEDCYRIGMSVREAVINAHNYGNQGERRKKIRLTIALEPEKLVVRILDEGRGFDLADVPDPLQEENLLRASGRGLFLMRSFMDELDVHPGPNGGAELVMTKRYPSSPAPTAEDSTKK
jgi:serine/threonine-protein kinase RsbW